MSYSLTSKMEKHTHNWIEKNNKLVCERCGKEKLILKRPANNIDIKIGHRIMNGKKVPYTVRNHRGKIYKPREWVRLYSNIISRKQRLTLNFQINTGARINEIRGVRVGDIDFRENRITIRNIKTKKDIAPIPRIIPISKKFKSYLQKVKKHYDLKPKDKFPILSTPGINKSIKKIGKKSKIPDYYMYSSHNIRKTFENWLLSTNVPEQKVIKHVGHNQKTSSQYYQSPDFLNFKEKQMILSIIGLVYPEMNVFK